MTVKAKKTTKTAAKSRGRESSPVTPLRLTQMAALLQRWRKENGLGTQGAMARVIGRALDREVTQSLVAQVETGKVTNPDAQMLEVLASCYQGSYRELVAAVATDKYRIPQFNASMLARDIRDLGGLADWEKKLPDGSELWIAALNFVDADNPEVREIVVSLLKKNCEIVYFINEQDTLPTGRFDRFCMQLAAHVNELNHRVPLYVPLSEHDRAIIATGFVISNPQPIAGVSLPSEGFLIMDNDDGKPEFGFRMTALQTQNRVALLRGLYPNAKRAILSRAPR